MANAQLGNFNSSHNSNRNSSLALPDEDDGGRNAARRRSRNPATRILAILALVAVVLLTPLLFAQGAPRISSADPTSGKVADTVTLMGENLGKAVVTGVFLSDDKNDYKAEIVDQGDSKIVLKVPKVKAGQYNFSVQVSTNIYIEPVHFKVEE
jgi:hypothetical protein